MKKIRAFTNTCHPEFVSGAKKKMLKQVQHDMGRKKAFTLAETLITLMVIGVVAALTIPSLMQTWKDRQYVSAYKKMYATIMNGFNQMIAEETISGHNSTEEFVQEMGKYFKISATCDNNNLANCFTEKITTPDEEIELSNLTKSSNLGKEWATDTNVNGVLLNDGTSMLIAYNKDGCLDHAKKRETIIDSCVAIVFDLDGSKKGGKYVPYDNEKGEAKSDINLYNASLTRQNGCDSFWVSDNTSWDDGNGKRGDGFLFNGSEEDFEKCSPQYDAMQLCFKLTGHDYSQCNFPIINVAIYAPGEGGVEERVLICECNDE